MSQTQSDSWTKKDLQKEGGGGQIDLALMLLNEDFRRRLNIEEGWVRLVHILYSTCIYNLKHMCHRYKCELASRERLERGSSGHCCDVSVHKTGFSSLHNCFLNSLDYLHHIIKDEIGVADAGWNCWASVINTNNAATVNQVSVVFYCFHAFWNSTVQRAIKVFLNYCTVMIHKSKAWAIFMKRSHLDNMRQSCCFITH